MSANRKKVESKKAVSKASGLPLSNNQSSKTVARKTPVEAPAAESGSAYKPGSLLARSGGMVSTVELSKRAAKSIS